MSAAAGSGKKTGRQVDLGLLVAARVLPCAVAVFSTYTDKELARHRTVLTRAARGEEDSVETLHDSLVEGAQGLAGLATVSGLVCAVAIWVSRGIGYLPLSVLGALATGGMVFAGTLAAIYMARMEWPFMRSVPRRSDFWAALIWGLFAVVLVLGGRLSDSA
jgi:hypothetical protein